MIFATGKTSKQVAKMSGQKLLNKILKILSKYFLRLKGPLANKS